MARKTTPRRLARSAHVIRTENARRFADLKYDSKDSVGNIGCACGVAYLIVNHP
jgi:hypothetical protein